MRSGESPSAEPSKGEMETLRRRMVEKTACLRLPENVCRERAERQARERGKTDA
jgi:hypothetical protein